MHAIAPKHLPWCLKHKSDLSDCLCKFHTYILCSFIALFLFGVEYWGAYISESSALKSDAYHVLSDGFMYGIAGVALMWSNKWAREMGRVSGIALCILGIVLIVQGIQQIHDRSLNIQSGVLFLIAFIGLIGNAFMSFLLIRTSHTHEHGSAHHGALIHTLGDLCSSIAVCVLGILLIVFPNNEWIPYLDPITGMLIGIWIAYEGVKNFK